MVEAIYAVNVWNNFFKCLKAHCYAHGGKTVFITVSAIIAVYH